MFSEVKDYPTEDVPEDESENMDSSQKEVQPRNLKPGALKLQNWLNKTFRIEMTDGRVLIGIFLCTDRDANVILGSCSEFLPADSDGASEEPRMLGLVMIPGRHIVSVHIDMNEHYVPDLEEPLPMGLNIDSDEII